MTEPQPGPKKHYAKLPQDWDEMDEEARQRWASSFLDGVVSLDSWVHYAAVAAPAPARPTHAEGA